MTQSLYDLLGVKPSADESMIRKAYRKVARKAHPDQNPGDPDAPEKFNRIQEAYEVLSNPERRKKYDLDGSTTQQKPTPPPEAEIATIVVPILFELLQDLGNKGTETTTDIIEAIRKRVNSALMNAEVQHANWTKGLGVLKKAIPRLKVKDGLANILRRAAESEIAKVVETIERIRADMDKMQRVLNYLKDCSYEVDSVGNWPGNWAGTTNTGFFADLFMKMSTSSYGKQIFTALPDDEDKGPKPIDEKK